ncbi:cob(I)yrinic acid a,c-diamide adenosyltransferase [Candidatus Woesearchaeota archaeon]|nr:cob(I)yrinic acid a,c-diamide adenosyltransferase [Candidatus Woesearchaeota archaeon]
MKTYEEEYDKGMTKLFGNDFISKSSLIMETLGTVDELNSSLGLARSKIKDKEVNKILQKIQSDLFLVGSHIVNTTNKSISDKDIIHMEEQMILLDEKLPALKTFILPSGIESASLLHVSRSLSRKLERRVVALRAKNNNISINTLKYLNRLSDLLFYLSRLLNKKAGFKEEVWKR